MPHAVRILIRASLLTLLLAGCESLPPASGSDPAASTGEAGGTASRSGDDSGTSFAILAPERYQADIRARQRELVASSERTVSAEEAGYYLDVQMAQLQRRLSDRPVQVLRDPRSILIRISGADAFDTGSHRLNRFVSTVLDEIAAVAPARTLDRPRRKAAVAGEFRETLLIVSTHTDSSGEAAYNQALSERRALAVARHLASEGVAAERLAIVGHGESRPLETEQAPGNRWPDRRIEIRLQLLLARTA